MDEKLFLMNSSLEVLSVKWHPEATSDLSVLLSDNSIRCVHKIRINSSNQGSLVPRLYNEMWKLNRVWRMGGPSDGGSRYSIDLGETAVDFDFGAPRFVQDAAIHLDESQVSSGGFRGEREGGNVS